MSKFVQFIKQNQKPEYHEFVFTERFRDENGDPLVFKIKGDVSLEKQEMIEKRCRIFDKAGNVTGVIKSKLALEMIAEWCVEPNFKDTEDLAALGLHLPAEYINAMLTSGEQLALMQKISELTGVGKSIQEDIEEAKN